MYYMYMQSVSIEALKKGICGAMPVGNRKNMGVNPHDLSFFTVNS